MSRPYSLAWLVAACVSQVAIAQLPEAPPPSPSVRPSGNNRAFLLVEPMLYEVGSTGIVITIPQGFVTDYASIPRRLWSLASPHDQYSRAAIVHDYLYWSQLCTRQQADNLFLIAMKESDVPVDTREFVYSVVRQLGGYAWDENRRQKAASLPKVVPLERKDFLPNWSWEMYRSYLVKNGVTDPPFKGNNYCHLGNSTEVPTGSSGRRLIEKKSLEVKTVIRAQHGSGEQVSNRKLEIDY